jgi:hypothetical protein
MNSRSQVMMVGTKIEAGLNKVYSPRPNSDIIQYNKQFPQVYLGRTEILFTSTLLEGMPLKASSYSCVLQLSGDICPCIV